MCIKALRLEPKSIAKLYPLLTLFQESPSSFLVSITTLSSEIPRTYRQTFVLTLIYKFYFIYEFLLSNIMHIILLIPTNPNKYKK